MIDMMECYKPNVDKLSQNQADMYSESLANHTKRAYLADLMNFFGVNELTDITIEMIQSVNVDSAQQYREKLIGKGYKPATINRKITSMSKFCEFCCRHEVKLMEYNPFSKREGMTRMKQNKKYSNTRCLTQGEVKKLVSVTMQNNDIEAVRDRIIVLLLATTGMRRSEVVNIKVGQIGKNQGRDVAEISNREKQRFVVISKIIKTFIDRYLAMRGITYQDKEEFLFVNHAKNIVNREHMAITDKTVYNIIKRIAGKAGIEAESVSPHCLRHTYITEALDAGISIESVQDIVGHEDSQTTRRYDHTNRVLKDNPADMFTEMFLGNDEE